MGNKDLVFHHKKQQGMRIIAEFLLNDFRFWCEVECYRNQAEAIHQLGHDGHYSAEDEQCLREKAQLICEQFLSSNVLPKCRINIQPEVSATITENVKLGMFDLSLFHDCTINIFPLLSNYWKNFCEKRHRYVSRKELLQFKRDHVFRQRDRMINAKQERLQNQLKEKEPAMKKSMAKKTNKALIDYCTGERYTSEWIDVQKTLDDSTTMSFSLTNGVKVILSAKNYSSPNSSSMKKAH